MVSVGIDIVEIKSIKNILELANRILSNEEVKLFEKQSWSRKQEFLAGRWALKEAIFKALPQKKLVFKNINISYNEVKQPITHIEGHQLVLSLSHSQTTAVAIAIVIV